MGPQTVLCRDVCLIWSQFLLQVCNLGGAKASAIKDKRPGTHERMLEERGFLGEAHQEKIAVSVFTAFQEN